MKKEFIPYTEALALKELGFDELCFACWKDKQNHKYNEVRFQLYFKYKLLSNKALVGVTTLNLICTSPTFSQAFRWFREKYKLDKTIDNWIEQPMNGEIWGKAYQYFINGEAYHHYFKTYEEAELECLKKLIEIVKDGR